MAYYGQLKQDGLATDVTMSEFADFYRKDRPYSRRMHPLKDILYGSMRQQFWYTDPWMRFCLDMNQGGRHDRSAPVCCQTGPSLWVGTKHIQDASYPFLVQSLYRAGYFTHYAGEGAVKSCKVSYEGEEVDYAPVERMRSCLRKATPAF